MRAVILAAGEGSRFRRTVSDVPKPLWNLFGLTLVERAVRCAAMAGCREAIVVTGYAADRVESSLATLSRRGERRRDRLPIPVRVARAAQWSRGNGASLMAAADAVGDERFLLLMADHVMDPVLCHQAVHAAERLHEDEVLLLVDRRMDSVFDVDEATKVRLDNGRIVAIGKQLDAFDAADTGVFVGGPSLLQALADLDDGAGSLTISDAAARLAERGLLIGEPVASGWWIDVDDAPALVAARKRLLRAAAASGGDGPVAKWLNRPLSLRVTAMAASRGVTPNAMTWVSFGVALAGASAFAVGWPWLGGVLVQLASVLDGSDGELARIRLEESESGSLLDAVLDRYADAAVLAGLMGGALAQRTASAAVIAATLIALAGAPLSAFIKERIQSFAARRGERGRYSPLRHDPTWLTWLPINRDGRCFVVFLAGIAGKPMWALMLLAAVVHIGAVGRLLHGMRWR